MKFRRILAIISICAALTVPQSVFASDIVQGKPQNLEQAVYQVSGVGIYTFNAGAIDDGWHNTSGIFTIGSRQSVKLQIHQWPQSPQDNGLINSSFYI
ncbi:hypothetical protein ABNF65_11160 [Paenibacillus larvae]